ncbi:MAG TPA: hypothetical protein VJQ59_17840 [Candidatus Sulfotelmatobacter sp.]|nr:hypothetical protein [Candidatus Sulfotelmatobacter sp.]
MKSLKTKSGRIIQALTIFLAAQALVAAAFASNIHTIASTVPANGDVNPYGLVTVPATVGTLTQGNLLVSNFNNSANLQGTGTTIMQISPAGVVSQFAQINADTLPGNCPGGVGLTTALVALKTGWVIVGSLPTTDGTSATAKAGCLIVLDSSGTVVETFSGHGINGPWDMTAWDDGENVSLFVTNVLNGTVAAGGNVVHRGTVLRLNLTIENGSMPSWTSTTKIGGGFAEKSDPAALVIGPTGVHLGGSAGTTLYVADSINNRIASIANAIKRTTSAGTGTTVTTGGTLNDPLGLTVKPNGNIITVNGDDGFGLVTSPSGMQMSKILLDSSGNPPGSGALFGVTFVDGTGLYYVDDATNTLNLFSTP